MPHTEQDIAASETVGCKAWRKANLERLCKIRASAEIARGLPARGSAKRMAAMLCIAPAALSNMLHGVKNIGDEAARSIEAKLEIEAGSLDTPPFSLTFADEATFQAAKDALLAAGIAS